jgi:hypothetical protein
VLFFQDFKAAVVRSPVNAARRTQEARNFFGAGYFDRSGTPFGSVDQAAGSIKVLVKQVPYSTERSSPSDSSAR